MAAREREAPSMSFQPRVHHPATPQEYHTVLRGPFARSSVLKQFVFRSMWCRCARAAIEIDAKRCQVSY